jgi:hypothetical protein
MPSRAAVFTECLQYDFVSLTGRLVRQTLPGPPDFKSFTRGDKPLVIWILQLDEGICIADSNSSYSGVYNEREIQLVLGDEPYVQADEYAQYRQLLGQKITVTGNLIPGGGRYEKRLALRAEEITSPRAPR